MHTYPKYLSYLCIKGNEVWSSPKKCGVDFVFLHITVAYEIGDPHPKTHWISHSIGCHIDRINIMWGVHRVVESVWAVLLVAFSVPVDDDDDVFSSTSFSFREPQLQGALEYLREGQDLVARGEYEEGCDTIMFGVYSGRRFVEAMQLEREEEDLERIMGIHWLTASYVSCSEARIQMEDWTNARRDAWAACMLSQNTNLNALYSMLQICEKTEDLFGQQSTLKSLETILQSATTIDKKKEEEEDPGLEVEDSSCTDTTSSKDQQWRFTLDEIRQRISIVETALQQRMNNSS